ncbi:MFS transporter [Cohnella silvisoli]|uniref:MFS transporter n=1 Tax=Cohnella silvisoli TaxID=2873699 RepID=A0ABV1KR82_9BACL|nr:MFS transporter [Cohnella silvisoli]MCD9021746.1 MFS transporter [Cohnella silvisoli]
MNKYSFRFLWIGQSFASLADVLYLVALITLLYAATGSATYTAMVAFLRCLANLISGFFAPLILDRFPLRSLLVYAQFGQATLLLGLVVLYFAQYPVSPPIILGFVILISILEAWISPAKNAIVPRLVDENQLVKANGLLATVDQGVRLAGWSLGAAVFVWLGALPVLWLTFALFALSAVAMTRIRLSATLHPEQPELQSTWHKLREGWVILWRLPVLRVISALEILEGLAGGIFAGAVMLVYVKNVLHRGEDWWGFINASFLVGTLVGGLGGILLSRFVDRWLGHTIMFGSLIFCVLTFSFAWIPIPSAALILNFLMGPAFQLRDIAQRTLCQKWIEPGKLPQVFSAKGTLAFATFGISSLLMAGLTDLLGVQYALTVSATLYATCAIIAVGNKALLLASSKA